jgi:NAD(P)-dependent dehydrogenase (short-subunit alcohol dehydrogenase family)
MTAKASYNFAGKTILITGGAGDIGWATAQRFAPDGAGVVLLKVVEQQMINSVPMRRLGSLEEVASGVAFLMSEEASYITGFNLELTGGQ